MGEVYFTNVEVTLLCFTTFRPVPFHMKVVYVEIMLIGTIAGCAATYSAITDLATNKFTVPCYVDPIKAST